MAPGAETPARQLMRVVTVCMMFVAGLFIFAGCGGKTVRPDTPLQEIAGLPDWVLKGGGAFTRERGKVIYGVGSAVGSKNSALLRTQADNRARNDVAKVVTLYTSSLMKDYMASTSAGDPDVTSEEIHIEGIVKTVTAMTMHGVEIVDHWQHPATGELFALGRLDLDAFTETVSKSRELDSRVRDFIRQNAERLHDSLEEEEAKMEARE